MHFEKILLCQNILRVSHHKQTPRELQKSPLQTLEQVWLLVVFLLYVFHFHTALGESYP